MKTIAFPYLQYITHNLAIRITYNSLLTVYAGNREIEWCIFVVIIRNQKKKTSLHLTLFKEKEERLNVEYSISAVKQLILAFKACHDGFGELSKRQRWEMLRVESGAKAE